MKILKELYYGNVAEGQRTHKPSEEKLKKCKFEEGFRESLSEEQKKIFDKVMDNQINDYCDEIEESYIQGFKTGLLVGIECSDLKL